MKRFIPLLLVFVVLFGCAQSRHKFTDEQVYDAFRNRPVFLVGGSDTAGDPVEYEMTAVDRHFFDTFRKVMEYAVENGEKIK